MSDAASVFDQYAEKYDQWNDSHEGKELFRVEVEAIRLLMMGLERSFLEIGVGTGRFAEALRSDLGVDPSARALELAEKRGIRVLQAKGEALPLENESVGAVFLLFTLCFVNDPAAVLPEAKRVLKQYGALIAGIINKESPWGSLYERKKIEGHPLYRHARFYRVDKVEKLLTDAGLSMET